MDRAYDKARTRLEKEIDVIEIIRMRRYLKAAMKMLLSPEQVISLKNECKFTGIDPDSDDSTSNEPIEVVKLEHPKPLGSLGKGVTQDIFSSASNIDQIDTQRIHNEMGRLEIEQSNVGI